MDSFSWNLDNSSKNVIHNSLDFKDIIHSNNNNKNTNPKKYYLIKEASISNSKNNKRDFNSLVKYAHDYLISFYKAEKDDYNIRMIEDILDNEDTHLVAVFKDFLIMGDLNEFMQKYYSISDSKRYLPKICDYYLKSSMIFPNYVSLEENKYIYKNIRKKQKLIDNQQEQDDMKENNKINSSSSESIDKFFSSKTLNSILQQTNTSNVKLIFGIEDNNNKKNDFKNNINIIDGDETPNKIIENFEEVEKKIIENKNKNKKRKKDLKENLNKNKNNSCNKIENSSNHNNKYKKYIYIKERNKNLNLLNINNTNKTSSNVNSCLYKKNKSKKRVINNYLSKNITKTENNSKNYIKSNSSVTGRETDYIQKKYFNYFFVNSQKNNKRKLLIENSLNKNKSILNTQINTIIPSKECISKFFINSNYSKSVLKYNSFNFITKNIDNKNDRNFPFSPSLNTIQVNPFKKKYYYNLNININNSNSARNLNNNQISNSNSNERINEKNKDKEKIKKAKSKNRNLYNNRNINKNHNKNASLTINILHNRDKNKIKQIFNTENNNGKNSQIKINDNNNKIYYNNIRTFGNNPNKNDQNVIDKIINSNRRKKAINKINSNNNSKLNKNNTPMSHIKIKNLNIQKIKSVSNIKTTTNITNKNKKLFINKRNSGKDIFNNRIFPVSPVSIKLDPNKTTSCKKILNIKPKKNKNNIYKNVNMNNQIDKNKHYFIDSIINSPKNKQLQIFNHGIKNQLIMEELNKKKRIILPFKKEINIINININGYNNTERGSLTSRERKNINKKRLKEYKGRNKAEINFYNQEVKSKLKNKNENKINNNNNLVITRNENNNPIIVKNIYDDNFGKNNIFYKEQNTENAGFFTSRK